MKLRHALLQQIELSIAMGVTLGYDFGWGKPICVSGFFLDGTVTKFSNIVIFMDTRLGDWIDAWVYLLEDEMAMIELGKELLAFATLDQSPLGVR